MLPGVFVLSALPERAPNMISGGHIIIYSKDAAADRAFFRDVLGFASVDAGHGWLIFALPPAEVAVHPDEVNDRHEFYFMCDDLKAEISALSAKGIRCSDVQEEALGFHHKNPASGRRRSRTLSAEAPDGTRTQVRLTQRRPGRNIAL